MNANTAENTVEKLESRSWVPTPEQGGWFRTWGFPLLLIACTPPTTLLLWITVTHFDGSFLGILGSDPATVLSLVPLPSWTALGIFGVWAAFQALLLGLLPGAEHLGPVTPAGVRPRYRLNGVSAFIVTHIAWFAATYGLDLFSPAVVYHHFGALLSTLSLFALVFCAGLYLKGVLAPSSPDAGRTGNLIWDYYWGVELHPTVGGLSLKQLFNCRLAMMGWSILLLSFAAAQVELHGSLSNAMAVSVGLQVAYIFKFFWWEGGYFNSLDIMHDRFGFYICWGVTAWLPCVYTLVGFYLVDHPIHWHPAAAAAMVVFGLASIYVNYAADEQRQRVRATGGETTVWGRKPEVIVARYVPADGTPRESLLLVSGWWGVSRHFHYLPELALSAAWTLPAGFTHLLPWFYVVYLTILLVDRQGRDERRCAAKYGADWERYRQRVPWRIIPGIY
jgi:7-dehydrocholesterol reductase